MIPRNSEEEYNSEIQQEPNEGESAEDLEQALAELGVVHACKDISNPGSLGTLGMMLESSGKGAMVDIDKIPKPAGVGIEDWLLMYQGYGFVMACAPEDAGEAIGELEKAGLTGAECGSVNETLKLKIASGGERATLFDLPHVIPMAAQRLSAAGMADRVTLVGGDFLADPLPTGADLAWVSAIIHQNSWEQNRHLFAAIAEALADAGQILIRDVLMDEARTGPTYGAMFAINMLVATEAGGTYTFDEIREDLETAGFVGAEVLRRDEGMNSVIRAGKP